MISQNWTLNFQIVGRKSFFNGNLKKWSETTSALSIPVLLEGKNYTTSSYRSLSPNDSYRSLSSNGTHFQGMVS